MPPKKNPNAAANANGGGHKPMEALQEEMNNKLSTLLDEVKSLKSEIKSVKQDNAKLKETVQNQAEEIAELRNELNDKELHGRSWSIRVNNIQVQDETNNRAVMQAVHTELIAPILAGAVESGEIESVPSCTSLIEIAHILPGKGARKPIIVRFFSRYWRSLLFRFRKDHAPRETATTNDRPGRMKYPFYEDLTRATFKQLKTIQSDERVTAAWTVSGVIRFKLDGDEKVYRVTSVYDTIDDLLG
jgi:mRNA-degrading endonuclease YafQ of YafQ-DinJ toxin-antitoxin module